MNCPQCNGELRIVPEQVDVDSNGLPIFHRIAYCDNCMIKKDIDVAPIIEESPIEPPQIYTDITDDPYKGYGKYDLVRKSQPPSIDASADLQTQLAQQELNTLNKNMDSKNKSNVMIVILLILTIASFALGIIPGGILFLIVLLAYAGSVGKKQNRKTELEHLAAGQKIINVCPKCKSENIEMHMVQTGGFTTHGTSRVANNINPLHPFTHTNVKKGTDYDFTTYGNQCHCLNCGNVFPRPEVHYV